MRQTTYRPLEESWWFSVVWVLAQVFMALMLIALLLALVNLIFLGSWTLHGPGPRASHLLGFGFITVCGLMSVLWKLHGDKQERQNPSIKSAYLIVLLLITVAYQAIDASLDNSGLAELHIYHVQVGPVVDAATGEPLSNVRFNVDGSNNLPQQAEADDGGYRLTWIDYHRYSFATVTSPGYETKTIPLSDEAPSTIELKRAADRTPVDE